MNKQEHPYLLFSKPWRSTLSIFVLSFLWLVLTTFLKMGSITTNPLSRVTTVERLVEANTWAHSSPHTKSPFPPTIDVVKVGEKIYSSKPPTYPLLMAGEAKIMKAITAFNFYQKKVDYIRMLTLINQLIPYMLLLWIAFLWMLEFTSNKRTINFMLLVLSFGNLAYGYAPTINNHTVSAICSFIGLYYLYRFWYKDENRKWLAAFVGFIVGFGVANEMPALIYATILVSLVAYKNPILAFILVSGMLIPGLISLGIYHEITGSYLPFVLQGNLYQFEGSFWRSPEGIDAVHPPKARYLFNILFGFKGLFSITPFFLLSIISFIRSFQIKHPLRWIWLIVMAGALAIITFVEIRTYNYGGVCLGARWFIVFMPMLTFMAFPLVDELLKRKKGTILCIFLLLLSLPAVLEASWIDAFIDGYWQRNWIRIFGTP